MSAAIWWLRRDLRLSDNQALIGALRARQRVIPVFVLDEKLLASPYVGEKRVAFLFAGLRALDADLRARGSYLVVRRGDPVVELGRLLAESGADVIFAEPDYSPYARRRDDRVGRELPVFWAGSPAARPPGIIVKANGEPYRMFTPFSRSWKALPELSEKPNFEAPQRIDTPPGLTTLPTLQFSLPPDDFPAGEIEAQRRLTRFTELTIYLYHQQRDRQDIAGTSQLSPFLRFGMLSARQAVAAARQAIHLAPDETARRSAEAWLDELIWRDFYIHLLYYFPRLRHENFRLADVRWVNDTVQFEAWKTGRTGYPIVDALMRQLSHTGWMHNRGRMITASFLTKDLLIDWRWGEKWFMQHLMDGDPAANNGGWQWIAGVGTDAAPYFRVFNPVSQSMKTDPQGVFIRYWLPELQDVPLKYLHQPWTMPEEVQRQAGCYIGRHYPPPLVDHAWAKERALQVYQTARSG